MNLIVLLLGLAMLSCNNPPEEEVDKRVSLEAEERPVDNPQTNGNVAVDGSVVNFSGISLLQAPGSDTLSEDDFNNILLVSRIDQNTTVLIGRDGISKQYGGEDGLVEILPKITPPSDRQLLTLDAEDFWLVGEEKVSKRKILPEGEGDPDQVILHNFDITLLSGDRSNMKILGATKNALILYLTTHIAIFTVKDGLTSAYEFQATLPSEATGSIVSAGETGGGGFWFATTDNRFALLTDNGGEWTWTIADVPINNIGLIRMLGVWLDREAQSAVGEVIAITDTSIFSSSAAPVIVPET